MARADTFINKFVDIYSQSQTNVNGLYEEDPTVMGFNLWFYFNDLPLGLNKTPSPLFSEQPGSDSAILYLDSIGESERSKSLKDFKERLRLLALDTPYYFQTIEGLAGINKFDPNNPFRGFDRKLTINTLESIDLRVSSMIAQYMDAVYDFEFHRLMVPQNLLYFSFYLMLNEIRGIRKLINAKAENDIDRYELLNENLNSYVYKFEMCTFDFENANPWNEMVDNKGGEPASNRFNINVGRIVDTHQVNFLQIASGSVPQIPSSKVAPLPTTVPRASNVNPDVLNPKKPNLGSTGNTLGFPTSIIDRAKQTANFVKEEILAKGKLLQQKLDLRILGQRALNDIFDQLDSRIRGFILGNVFSDLNQFINDDFYTSVKQFVENVVKERQTIAQAATNAFGTEGPPKIIQAKIGSLGEVALEYLRLQEAQLGNMAGFDSDPFQATENQVLTGALGNVFG